VTQVVLEEERQSRAPADSSVSSAGPTEKLSAIFWLVLIAFLWRVELLLILKTYRTDRIDDFNIAGETTNIAVSIARGRGFSSPFNDDLTGPTAWLAPVYPYLIALVLRCFGLMTKASIIATFTLQSLFSALTIIPIVGIAEKTVGRRAGIWAAWVWALFPWFSKWSLTWMWDMSLSALLLTLLFWRALQMPEAASRKSWIAFGALWGVALLVNPALGSLLPVSLAWCGYELVHRKQGWLKPVLTAALACVVVISPWLVRNRIVFGQWVFLRSNFGFEFALGNYHGSLGRGWGGSHPSGNQKEFHKYWQMGEIAYVTAREQQALQFVRNNPSEFIDLTIKRLAYFWDGSSMDYLTAIPWYWMPWSFVVVSLLLLPVLWIARRRNLHAWPMFFGLLLLYPIPYYLTFNQVRYRHAIEPILLLLIAYAGVEAAHKVRALLKIPITLRAS
jgi:4-amino-4-deoxy-L-arabinose transferase-like glycosyltransferase